MSNSHIDPVMASILDALQVPNGSVRAAIATDRQYIDAVQARIHELKQEVQTLCTRLEHLIRANRSLHQRLHEAAPNDIELDLSQVYKTRQYGGYVLAPESVVIEATKRLRARYDIEFADLLEAEYRLQMDEASKP